MRPSREEALIATAFVWSKRSTCERLSVGAVIHREGRILVQGYNGAPAGMPHCDHRCTCTGTYPYYNEEFDETRHRANCPATIPCTTATHAEQNAIAFAARYGVRLEDSELVVTHQPCASCARSIINAGIQKVTYVHEYRLVEGLHLLLQAGILVEQYLDWEEPKLVGLTGDETD